MQDIHAIGGGVAGGGSGGRLFASGSGGGGDRRLLPQNSQNHQALKCPRCDSLNTKFCYYNNYNLSQPRHFCKKCRRYWTKGGVLRNVPVGGGCRKAKRSKPKQSSASSDDAAAATEAGAEAPGREDNNNSNSHSSSESSSLTATTTAAKNTAVAAGSSGEVASATINSSNTMSNLINFQDSRFFVPQSSFDQQQQMIDPNSGTSNRSGQMFQEIGGDFTGLMTSSNDHHLVGFNNMADVYRLQQNHQSSNQVVGSTGEDVLKMEPINCGFLDQTAQIGFSGFHHQSRMSDGGGLDWQINGGGGDQGFFDFTGTVDHTYWGQNQWSDNDQSLNFPPLV